MNPIFNSESVVPFSSGPFAPTGNAQRQQTVVGSASLSQSTDVTLTTDEGDTVTLNLASFVETHAGIDQGTLDQGDRQVFSRTTYFESSRQDEMAIEINGDLNADEREDIRAALQTIGTMIDDFLNGNLDEMVKDATLLEELDTISSLEASFSYDRQAMVATEESVVIESAMHHAPRGRLQALMRHIDNFSDDLVQAVKDFGGRQDRLATSVAALLHSHSDENTASPTMQHLTDQVLQTTRSAYIQKMELASITGGFEFKVSA
jgi:hypothetical protein